MDRAAREQQMQRLPVLLAASSGAGSVAILAAVLLLVFWGGHSQRFWLLMACLGVAVAGIGVVAVHRIRTPPLTYDEVFRHVLDEPVPGGAAHHDTAQLPAVLPRQPGRARFLLVAVAAYTWVVVSGFVLAMADTEAPPEIRKLKDAGAVVATLTITSEYTHTIRSGDYTIYDQSLTFDMPGAKADAGGRLRTVHTTPAGWTRFRVGDRIPVIYVPDKPGIKGYAGPSRENVAGRTEGYNEDVERLFAERALSGTQLGFALVAWLFIIGIVVVGAGGGRRPKTLNLPGSRALRGTFRSGRIQGAALVMQFKGVEPEFTAVRSALEGRHVWLAWDARRVKRFVVKAKGRPVRRWKACPAVVVFDSGHAVYGHVDIHEPQQPGSLGVEAGGEGTPLDNTRQVRIWQPQRIWPVTLVRWGAVKGLALSMLITGVLFTDLVSGFFPRLFVGLVGAAAFFVGVGGRFLDEEERDR
ncbi:hypothetical protein ACIQPT_20250 [Streptomyces sp. NPDC091289]|uniref:hypothetical protein n=1 Tax=Streptomyces sp. NPDC091289 TaxID=3365989 RepID=UPI0037F96A93